LGLEGLKEELDHVKNMMDEIKQDFSVLVGGLTEQLEQVEGAVALLNQTKQSTDD